MNKNEIKSNLTKKRLCDSYINLYKKKNIDQITVKEITETTGYNRGTFYIYYKDIYDIHDQIQKSVIKKAENKVRKIINEKKDATVNDLFNMIIAFYDENEKYLLPLITKDNSFAKKIKQTMKPVMSEFFKKDLNNNIINDYLIEYHLCAVFGLINFWIEQKKNISKEELFTLVKNISNKGVINIIVNNN